MGDAFRIAFRCGEHDVFDVIGADGGRESRPRVIAQPLQAMFDKS